MHDIFQDLNFILKSKSFLWMNMKTMSMTWFHYEWTSIERRYQIDQKSFSAFFWILSSITSTSCVRCLKFYSFRSFWSCIKKIKSNDCFRSWRIFFYSSTFCTWSRYKTRSRRNIVFHIDRSCRCDHIFDSWNTAWFCNYWQTIRKTFVYNHAKNRFWSNDQSARRCKLSRLMMIIFFSLLTTFFDHAILTIFKLECKISFCFFMRRMIFCWFVVWTSTTRTSWINISKILDITYVDEITCFNDELSNINRFLIFFERVINFMFSLNKRRVVITFFFISSTRCSLFISSLTKKARMLFFFRCFFILYIIVFFFLTFFSCFRW